MKPILSVLFLLVTLSLRAAMIEGDIQLKYVDSGFDDGVFKKEFGDTVKATCEWRAGEFFGRETVFAGISVHNTGKSPMYFNYYVAFFDKDKKLVGATGQSPMKEGLKAGGTTQMGSCLIHLPKDRYKDIVSYQAIIYESAPAPAKPE